MRGPGRRLRRRGVRRSCAQCPRIRLVPALKRGKPTRGWTLGHQKIRRVLMARGRSKEGLALWLPSLSDPDGVARPSPDAAFVGCSAVGDHLIVLHSAVRACPGYDRHEAPSMLMEGSSVTRHTEHGRPVTAQLTRRHGTLEEAIDAGIFALSAAEVARGVRRQARAASEDYFYNRLGLTPGNELRQLTALDGGLELLSEPMYRALEGIVELVVDGDYEELREVSRNRLEVEELRRRLEDDCPEGLVLPPREVYRVEAITKTDDPDDEGWTYFLDLWTENGPARLHIEGELEETGGRFEATLNDIVP